MKCRGYLLIIAFLAASTSAIAEELSSRDFAYGYMIEAPNNGAVYSLPVPGEVYRTVRRADLGDIRVFNGAGELVPHALRGLIAPEENTRTSRDLPFFPLFEQDIVHDGNMSLSVRRNTDGTIIDIDSGQLRQEGDRSPSGFLLDLGEKPSDISTLELYWQADEEHTTNSVRVDQSADLQRWQTVVAKTALVDLEYGGNRVEQRKIELPYRSHRYVKISWLQQQKPAAVKRVAALSRPLTSRQNLQWLSLYNGVKSESNGKTVIDFTSRYRLPARSMQLQFPEANSLVSGLVQSRQGKDGNWREQCRTVFYSLDVDGERLQNEPCSFTTTNDSEWRLVVLDDGAGLAGSGKNLLLDLGWQSDELLFLARGTGPFLLAYGSGKLENNGVKGGADMVLTAISQQQTGNIVQSAKLGKRIELGGEKALVPPPPPTPWKTWLLWAVLIAGVLGMACMARNLMNDLRRKD